MAGPTSVKERLGRVVKIVVMNTKRETCAADCTTIFTTGKGGRAGAPPSAHGAWSRTAMPWPTPMHMVATA